MAKKTITIAEVAEPRERQGKNGPYHILDVKDSEGRKYSCLKSSLFEHFKAGASLDCDVKEEQREYDGNQYTSRTIMDVFVEGQAVAGQRQGGGRSYGKPLENVQFERASIEFNNAMSEVGQRVSEGKAPHDIEAAYWGHLRRLLRVGLQEAYDAATQAIIATAQSFTHPTLIPQETPPEGQEAASAPPDHIPGRSDDEPRQFANRGAFFQAAFKELGLGPSKVNELLGIGKDAPIPDIVKAWQTLVGQKDE